MESRVLMFSSVHVTLGAVQKYVELKKCDFPKKKKQKS